MLSDLNRVIEQLSKEKGIDKGMEAVRMVWVRMREEYLNRCAIAGFDRRELGGCAPRRLP